MSNLNFLKIENWGLSFEFAQVFSFEVQAQKDIEPVEPPNGVFGFLEIKMKKRVKKSVSGKSKKVQKRRKDHT